MAKVQFTGSEIRRNLPRGGIKLLCQEFDLSDTWVRRVLDGKEDDTNNIIGRAKDIIAEHKRLQQIKKAKRDASIQSLNFCNHDK
jgi:hypothetical protein